MRLRRKFFLYLVAVHLPFAVLAWYVLTKNRPLLLAVEGLFLLSFLLGVWLLRSFFVTLELIGTGATFIEEQDFGSRFREVGHPEMDVLIRIYNRMVDDLREERIRQQEQHHFLDKLMNASPAGVLILDFDDRITTLNPSAEALLRLPRTALMGQKIDEIDVPFAHELAGLAPGESRVIPLGGSRRTKCQRSEFIDRGFPRPFFVLEELTEELRRSEKAAYEKLIRMMSHEVNNSLGAATSLLQSCLNYKDQIRMEDREDFERALEVAIGRAARLGTFMKELADVVRIPPPKLLPCDVKMLLDHLEAVFRAESQRRGISWVWRNETALPLIAMDHGQMEQVFVNILKNAVEAIEEKGTITLHLSARDNRPRVAIEDTGIGISPEVRAGLFTPFFTTKENGQGIGLTVVQEILSAHRFDYSLDGGPGRPTRFTIYLGAGSN